MIKMLLLFLFAILAKLTSRNNNAVMANGAVEFSTPDLMNNTLQKEIVGQWKKNCKW